MKEFTVPDDGFVLKTNDGRPILELSIQDEGNIIRLFGADGEPRIVFGTNGDTGVFVVGNPETEGVMISVSPDASEIVTTNSRKTIATGIDATHTEIRFVNADNALTNKMYVDDNGGQIGLSDHQGNLAISAGAEQDGGTCHVMNANGDTVARIASADQSGNVTLLDDSGRVRIMIGHKSDANIHLVDTSGRVVWTTLAE